MKVKELVELLQNCNQEAELFVCYECDNPMDQSNSVVGVLEIKDIGKRTTVVNIRMD